MPSRALSSRTIVVWGIGVAVVAVAAVVLLWTFLGSGDPGDAARLDAVRTASSLVIGAGGAAALLLAARRQRYVELDHEQKEHDAAERRVTELYGKAADQLGSDKAPVRLAGVYALERLAQDDPRHRQTIANLLCAYLRMPWDHEDTEERLVRYTVQDTFEKHLRPAHPEHFWPDIDLNLTGAHLAYFWFRDCAVRDASFRHVTFHAIAAFRGTTFAEYGDFTGATFTSTADLRRVVGLSRFKDATFEGTVDLAEAHADLTGATATTGPDHVWPAGWGEEEDGEKVRVVRLGD